MFSRCGDPDTLCVFEPRPDASGAVWIKNIVYEEELVNER